MKRISLISIALLFGGVLMAQTGDRNTNYPYHPFAVKTGNTMVPDQMAAKPYPVPWNTGSDNPTLAPGKPYATAIRERAKVQAPWHIPVTCFKGRMSPH